VNDVSGSVSTVGSMFSVLAIIIGISMVISSHRRVSTMDFAPRDGICHSYGILGCSAWKLSLLDAGKLHLMNMVAMLGKVAGEAHHQPPKPPWLMVKIEKDACRNP